MLRKISFIITLTSVLMTLLSVTIFSAVWDDSCKNAIDNLENAQMNASEAYEQLNVSESNVESAKFSYHSCKSAEGKSCESERIALDIVIEEYNYSINQLNNVLSTFKDIVRGINESCLQIDKAF